MTRTVSEIRSPDEISQQTNEIFFSLYQIRENEFETRVIAFRQNARRLGYPAKFLHPNFEMFFQTLIQLTDVVVLGEMLTTQLNPIATGTDFARMQRFRRSLTEIDAWYRLRVPDDAQIRYEDFSCEFCVVFICTRRHLLPLSPLFPFVSSTESRRSTRI